MQKTHNHISPIKLFLLIHQPYYTAGEYLEGEINIDCLQKSNHHNLFLRLRCQQKILWTHGHQTDVNIFSNILQTYNHTFLVHQFKEKYVEKGQYSFPFKFRLPDDLPGSLFESKNKFIKYYLKAILLPSVSGVKVKQHELIINIIQPKINESNKIQTENTCSPKFFGCCFESGHVKIKIQCNKNFVKPGSQVEIKAQIDNTHNTRSIKSVEIKFMQKNILIGSKDQFVLGHNNEQTLIYSQKSITPGSIQNIEFKGLIPHNFSNHSTSIGQIIGKYFSLDVIAEMGCFIQPSICELNVIYNSDNPIFEQNKSVQKPKIWSPIVKQKYINDNLLPYKYKPHPKISHLNRRNSMLETKQMKNSIKKLENMNEMTYSQNFTQSKVHDAQMNKITSQKQLGQGESFVQFEGLK